MFGRIHFRSPPPHGFVLTTLDLNWIENIGDFRKAILPEEQFTTLYKTKISWVSKWNKKDAVEIFRKE